MVILGLCGSLRQGSHNRQLLEAVRKTLPAGTELQLFQSLADLPHYSEDTTAPGSVQALRSAIAAANAVLIATPEYNSSIPGVLKNALDWASRPFPANALRGKPAAVIGASTGLFGAVWAQAEVRKVLTTIGAQVVDDELPVGQAHEAFSEEGILIDQELQSRLIRLKSTLLDASRDPLNLCA